MELIHITDHTCYLSGQASIPVYLINQSDCILLDTGSPNEFSDITTCLSRYKLTPVGMICTHIHMDHYGNARNLKEHYGAQLAMPAGEAALASNSAALLRYMDYSTRTQNEQSIICSLPCPADVIIYAHQETLNFCGTTFLVHHLPGHSFDTIAITTPDNVCYLSDALLNQEQLTHAKLPYCDFWSMDIASKKQILELSPRHALLAHKEIVTVDLHTLVKANISLMEQRLEELSHLFETPLTRAEFMFAARQFLHMISSRPETIAHYERHLRSYFEQLIVSGDIRPFVSDSDVFYSR